jgi:hypothetical protein
VFSRVSAHLFLNFKLHPGLIGGSDMMCDVTAVPLFSVVELEYCYRELSLRATNNGKASNSVRLERPWCGDTTRSHPARRCLLPPPSPLHWLNSITEISRSNLPDSPDLLRNGSGVQAFRGCQSSLLEPDPETSLPSCLCNWFSPTRPILSDDARGENKTVA